MASLNRQMLPLLERTQQVLSSFGQSESSSASSTVAGAAAAGAEQAHSITFTPNTAAADGIKERLE